MYKAKKEIGVQLFGFKKKHTDKYLQYLVNSNNQKLSEIKEKIEAQKLENEKILKEANDLSNEIENQIKVEDIIKFGLKRVEKFVHLMHEVTKDEVEILNAEWRKKELEFDNEINEYNMIIHDTQINIKNFLENVKITDRNLAQIIKINPNIIIENIGIAEDVAVTKDISIAEEAAVTKAIPIASDIETQEVSQSHGSVEEARHNDFSKSFWGDDLDDLDNDLNEHVLKNSKVDEVDKIKNRPEERNANLSSPNETNNQLNETNNQLNETKPQSNPEIEHEIKNIKNNYLIGKIVGEDLLDSNGQVIASKNSYITDEVIEKVEREGKLVELIVNMIIPEKSA